MSASYEILVSNLEAMRVFGPNDVSSTCVCVHLSLLGLL